MMMKDKTEGKKREEGEGVKERKGEEEQNFVSVVIYYGVCSLASCDITMRLCFEVLLDPTNQLASLLITVTLKQLKRSRAHSFGLPQSKVTVSLCPLCVPSILTPVCD